MNTDGGHSRIEHAVREKKPVPEIDFTLHTMEDGAQVSTQERVCKGGLPPVYFIRLPTDGDAPS